MIAAYNGYYNIVKRLVDTGSIIYDPIDGNNALHSVLNGIMTCHQEVLMIASTEEDFVNIRVEN